MNLLTIKNLTKAYTDKVLFDGVDFALEEGEKVGIIGINGTGKSTLLRIIAGIEEGDEGEYTKGTNVVINYLSQNPEFEPDINIYDYVIGKNLHSHESFGVEGEAKTILNKLGFEDIYAKVDTLSGGQKKKVALAGALLSKNEVLILDEPTNHLDHEMTEWLEGWLRDYRGCLVMVTHDRYFLDLVCNRIVELDKTKLYSYKTNYEGFLQLKIEREAMAIATQEKHENILRKEIAWMQRGARARSTKQKAHIKRYEALRDEEKVQFDGQVEIGAISSRLGKKTIELNRISKSFGDKKVIDDFTYIFLKDDRVGILGPNGCGKSTLIKMIVAQYKMSLKGVVTESEKYNAENAADYRPDTGLIEIGDTVKIGYYAQEAVGMNPEQKVIDYIRDTAENIQTKDGFISASQMLEKFLFAGSLQYQKIGKLSGGEKRRLYLAKVLMEAPNVLILDEPTNDLDISTLCILEDYLDTFPGILITVSHDRYFLDRAVRRMLTFDPDGSIKLFNGSYTEYYQEYEAKLAEGKFNSNTTAVGNGNATAIRTAGDENAASEHQLSGADAYKAQKQQNKKLKFTFAEQREYDTIEQTISDLEEKISELEKAILDPKISADFVKLNELSRAKEETELLLEEKMERYLYLEDLAEQIKNQ